MAPSHARSIFENAQNLHHHLKTAPLAERVAARRHARIIVRDARARRDAALPAAEAAIPATRRAIEAAEHALAEARVAHARAIAAIDQVRGDYQREAGVLEMRLQDHEDREADAVLRQEGLL